MSIIKVIDPGDKHIITKKASAGENRVDSSKRRRTDQNSTFMELRMDKGAKTLKDIDPELLKADIKRWAKDVAAYAYHVSSCRCPQPVQPEGKRSELIRRKFDFR